MKEKLQIKKALRRFGHEQSGAVTADWVVAAALAAGFGFAMSGVIMSGAGSLSDNTSSTLSQTSVKAEPKGGSGGTSGGGGALLDYTR